MCASRAIRPPVLDVPVTTRWNCRRPDVVWMPMMTTPRRAAPLAPLLLLAACAAPAGAPSASVTEPAWPADRRSRPSRRRRATPRVPGTRWSAGSRMDGDRRRPARTPGRAGHRSNGHQRRGEDLERRLPRLSAARRAVHPGAGRWLPGRAGGRRRAVRLRVGRAPASDCATASRQPPADSRIRKRPRRRTGGASSLRFSGRRVSPDRGPAISCASAAPAALRGSRP